MRFMYPYVGEGRAALAVLELPGRTGEFWVSVALCSPKDQFVRAKGRTLAALRLGNPRHSRVIRVAVNGSSLRRALTQAALDALADSLPRWALATGWWYAGHGELTEVGETPCR